jgi:hypothetical protein
LIFITYTNIDIQDISLLSIKLKESNNPNAILWGLWLSFLYLFIRYYQYFVQEAYHILRATFTQQMSKRTSDFSYKKMLDVSSESASYEPNSFDAIKNKNWSIKIKVPQKRIPGKVREAETIEYVFTKIEILTIYLKSLIYMTIQHHNVSDYLFPFLLAIFCAMYKVLSLFTLVA